MRSAVKTLRKPTLSTTAEKPLAFNPVLTGQRSRRKLPPHFRKEQLSDRRTQHDLERRWGGQDLTPAERAIFKLILPRYYRHLNENKGTVFPGMHSFYHFLRRYQSEHSRDAEHLSEMKYFDLEQFLIVLKPFVSGEYKEVLNAAYELDISEHPLVCFDLDKINSDPVLYPVVTLLITELALDQIRKYPDQIKYLYLDEAWAMLSGKLAGVY